jgi:hypothetical protein
LEKLCRKHTTTRDCMNRAMTDVTDGNNLLLFVTLDFQKPPQKSWQW